MGTNHNMDFLKSNIHKNTQTFIDKILECRMIPTITQPTRISKTTATLIDNILITQKHCEWYDSCVLIDDISDHLPCLIRIRSYKATKKKVTYIESRDTRTKYVKRLKKQQCACWDQDWGKDTHNENYVAPHNTSITQNMEQTTILRMRSNQRIRNPELENGHQQPMNNPRSWSPGVV